MRMLVEDCGGELFVLRGREGRADGCRWVPNGLARQRTDNWPAVVRDDGASDAVNCTGGARRKRGNL